MRESFVRYVLGSILLAASLTATARTPATAPPVSDTKELDDDSIVVVGENGKIIEPLAELDSKVKPRPAKVREELAELDPMNKDACKNLVLDRLNFLTPTAAEWAAADAENKLGKVQVLLPGPSLLVFRDYSGGSCHMEFNGLWFTAPGVPKQPLEPWVLVPEHKDVSCEISNQECTDLHNELQKDHTEGKFSVPVMNF